jgi:hypothetical protein
MRNLFATCAAIAVTAMIALPAPASAASNKASGVTQTQTAPTDISAARRHYYRGRHWGHRYGYRVYGRPYYGGPYNAYAYDPYYRPYYRPGVSVGVGPFGFGFGF